MADLLMNSDGDAVAEQLLILNGLSRTMSLKQVGSVGYPTQSWTFGSTGKARSATVKLEQG